MLSFSSQALTLRHETLRKIPSWELNSFRVFRSDFFNNPTSFDYFCKNNACDASSFKSLKKYNNEPTASSTDDKNRGSRDVHFYVAFTTLSAMNITKDKNKTLLLQITEYRSDSLLEISKHCEKSRELGTCGLVKELKSKDGEFYYTFNFYLDANGRPKRNPLRSLIINP